MKFINELKNGNISSLYLIYGEEAYKRKVCKDALIKNVPFGDAINYSYYEGKNINFSEVYEKVITMPFFAEKRLIIVENSGKFKAKKKSGEDITDDENDNNDSLIEKIISEVPSATVIAFIEESAAKTKKIYKAIANNGVVQACDTDKPEDIIPWIINYLKHNGISIDRSGADSIVQRVGADYTKITNEIEKLISYVDGRDVITEEDIDVICSEDIESKIFDMLDAMGKKNSKLALEKYYVLLSNREPALYILAMIRKQYRLMLESAELGNKRMNEKQVAQATGNHPYSVSKAMDFMRKYYKRKDVINILNMINDTDFRIKNGDVEDIVGVETLIIEISAFQP